MDLLFVTWMLCCALGIILMSWSPVLPDLLWCSPFVLFFLVSLKYRRLLLFGAVSLGLLGGYVSGCLGVASQLHESLEGEEVIIEGLVTGLPSYTRRSQRFNLKLQRMMTPENSALQFAKSTIRLNWYETDRLVKPGEIWRLKVKLKRPRGLANPGGFNYETWLFRAGIGATGYVRKGEVNRILAHSRFGAWHHQIRYRMLQALHKRGDELRHPSLLATLLLGDGSAIDRDQWSLFSRTGTNHLFVISGLHIGFVALCGYFISFQLCRWMQRSNARIASQRCAMLIAVVFAAGYSLLAGFSLPTQRALVMLACLFGARWLYLNSSVWFGYAGALLIVLCIDPLAPQTSGFWLSFTAVGGLLFAFQGYTVQRGIWWKWGRPQWVVFLVLGPILVRHFQQFSLIAPLANIVAIPIVGLLVVPLTLGGGLLILIAPELAFMLFQAADGLLFLVLEFLSVIDRWPLSVAKVSTSLDILVIGLLGSLCLLLPRGVPARWLGICCMLVMFINSAERPGKGEFVLWVYDVGQGSAHLIQTANYNLVYDVGPVYSERFNAVDAVLMPHFRQRQINQIDRLIISHGDQDHAGAVSNLLAELPVKDVITGNEVEVSAPMRPCRSGERWVWDGIEFTLFQAGIEAATNSNNQSCLLRVAARNGSVLLSGDIEKTAEADLLRNHDDALRSDVLLVPHHGSQTSSSRRFIRTVAPDVAIYSAGYRNRFGHPHPRVNQRYIDADVSLYNTASSGAIEIRVGGGHQPPQIRAYRRHYRRYWFSD